MPDEATAADTDNSLENTLRRVMPSILQPLREEMKQELGAVRKDTKQEFGTVGKRVGRLLEAQMKASPQLFTSARVVVERHASCSPFTADYSAFIDALLKDDAGFRVLLKLVLKRLQKEYSGPRLSPPGAKDPWSEQLEAVKQMKTALSKHYGKKETSKSCWQPFLEKLLAYAEHGGGAWQVASCLPMLIGGRAPLLAAARPWLAPTSAGGTAGLRRFFMEGGEQADRLAVSLVVALAGHELRDSVEVDNVPLLTQQAGGGVLLHRPKRSGSGWS